jgi:hypothetical protein
MFMGKGWRYDDDDNTEDDKNDNYSDFGAVG